MVQEEFTQCHYLSSSRSEEGHGSPPPPRRRPEGRIGLPRLVYQLTTGPTPPLGTGNGRRGYH